MAWVSNQFSSISGWVSLFVFNIIGALILAGGWKLLAIQEQLPGWLLRLTIGAALIRLLFGMVWITVLPVYGYNSPSEQKGYVMSDAFKRDAAAWKLAQSQKPLSSAFGQYRKADQYGGLLWISAALYRSIGGDQHYPLEMVTITAAFSALSILLAWGFTRRAWDDKIAWGTAWVLALYPETVLLGSTQMREAFLIPLTMAAFYGLARYHHQHTRSGAAWILGSLIFILPFSPPTAVLVLGGLLITGLVWEGSWASRLKHKPLFWVALGAIAVLILIGSFLALERLAPRTFQNPLELLGWWFNKSAQWQAHLTERASGWVQKIFRSTPDWTHTPLLLAYGVLQPFLPAAIADFSGTLIWRLIALWRAIGWAIMLPLLVYAPIRAFNHKYKDRLAMGLSLVVWLSILITAFRAGGDPWDNVRYRATFAGLQVALAVWAWIGQRRTGDPWLRWALILIISILLWFIPWYLLRYVYFPWPIGDPFRTFGLGLTTAFLLIILDWASKKK